MGRWGAEPAGAGIDPSGTPRQLILGLDDPAGLEPHGDTRRMGQVPTPEVIAGALARWAILSPGDTVLDLGVGEGVFALAAVERLRILGASEGRAAEQVHGAERDPEVFRRAQAAAMLRLGRQLPNVVCADFYDTLLPTVDAVVGNPPYIRRHYQEDLVRIRAASGARTATGLTDSYCYFLLRACRVLREGGRLAVIVSASWLDMKYGLELKRLLLDRFRLRLVLGFDGQVFGDALVKPVVLLAEKTADHAGPVPFARFSHLAPLDSLDGELDDLASGLTSDNAVVVQASRSELSPAVPWSAFLKAPGVYAALVKEAGLVPLREVAESRIGLQTFARRFYTMTRAEADGRGIESEFLMPVAISPREIRTPVIEDPARMGHLVLACDLPDEERGGTGVGRYIATAMRTPVRVRGKDQIVRGYHQLPRVARARRNPWYNLRTAILRRGSFPILLPRRIFGSYLVVHNRAGVVANEDFIELRPLEGDSGTIPLLVFLNSAVGEFLLRTRSFQYGGGVFNLNPGPVREIPVLDVGALSDEHRVALSSAWQRFVSGYGSPTARRQLDLQVVSVLRLEPDLYQKMLDALTVLSGLARTATIKHRDNGGGDDVPE